MRLHSSAAHFITPVVAAAALLVPATPAVAADPATPPTDSRPVAARALDRATSVLTGSATPNRRRDATMSLVDLRKHLAELDGRDRQRAEALFARPDGDPNEDSNYTGVDTDLAAAWDQSEKEAAETVCSELACAHWVPTGTPNDSAQPSRHGTTLSAAQRALAAADQSWATEVTEMGYLRPPSDDDDDPATENLDGKVDIYLSDVLTEDGGYFGYAVPEFYADDSGARAIGYLVIDNDMAEAATATTTATELVQVTTAHEFFHLVQFGYDVLEHAWFMESTAAWMEEQVFDSVDDNRRSIPYSSLKWTQMPLDTHNGSAEYGSWVFHELYTHMLKNDEIVREAWEKAAQGPDILEDGSNVGDRVNFRWALDKALGLHGWNLARAFSSFGGSSLGPRLTRNGVGVYYPEGMAGNYPSAHFYKGDIWQLSTGRRGVSWRGWELQHWSGAVAQFKPDSTLSGAWKLGVKIDNPATQSAAYAITFYKDGTAPRLMSLVLNSSGDASFTVPFDYRKVSRVAIYQGNTSPSDGRSVYFKASIFK